MYSKGLRPGVLLMILTSSFLAAAATSVKQLNTQGLDFMAKGKYREALQKFQEASLKEPNQPVTLANRGSAFLALGLPDEAVRDFSAALTLQPKMRPGIAVSMSSALVERARAFLKKGQPDPAFGDLVKAVEWNSKDAMAFAELAYLAARKKDYNSCLTYGGKAIAARPNFAVALATRGTCLSALNRPQEALKDLNKAIEINKAIPESRLSRAGAYVQMGNCKKAREDIKMAVSLNPDLGWVGDQIKQNCTAK